MLTIECENKIHVATNKIMFLLAIVKIALTFVKKNLK